MERNHRLIWRAVFAAISIFSFIFSIVVMVNCENEHTYEYVYLLPFAHACISFLCTFLYEKVEVNMISLVYIGLYTVRNVFGVVLLVLSDYTEIARHSGRLTLNIAICIMSVETLAVLAGIPWVFKKTMYGCRKRCLKLPKVRISMFAFVFAIAVLFCTAVVIRYPNLLKVYKNIFNSKEYLVEININEVYGYNRIFSIFKFVFDFVKLGLAAILVEFSRRFIKTGILQALVPFLSMIVFFLLADGGSAHLLTVVMAVVYAIYLIFPKQRKVLLSLSIIFFMLTLVMILAVKGTTTRNMLPVEYMSRLLNSYIPGITAVSACVDMRLKDIGIGMETFFNDTLLGWIPFLGSSVKANGHSMSYYFNENYTSMVGQIVPCIGQLYFYFGVLAFVPLLGSVYMAHYAYRRARNAKDSYIKMIWLYLGIHLARTPAMMNFTIAGNIITRFFLLWWVFSLFSPEGLRERKDSVSRAGRPTYTVMG